MECGGIQQLCLVLEPPIIAKEASARRHATTRTPTASLAARRRGGVADGHQSRPSGHAAVHGAEVLWKYRTPGIPVGQRLCELLGDDGVIEVRRRVVQNARMRRRRRRRGAAAGGGAAAGAEQEVHAAWPRATSPGHRPRMMMPCARSSFETEALGNVLSDQPPQAGWCGPDRLGWWRREPDRSRVPERANATGLASLPQPKSATAIGNAPGEVDSNITAAPKLRGMQAGACSCHFELYK